ncbi:uncharacterized protein BKA78DRAFT_312384, partial [Phyllosticta capitalensis]|uniref:uncharacterized protein n=1 Tax=Phyllosticta capitalensis TaxID=121624 RepID=UPI00313060A1
MRLLDTTLGITIATAFDLPITPTIQPSLSTITRYCCCCRRCFSNSILHALPHYCTAKFFPSSNPRSFVASAASSCLSLAPRSGYPSPVPL